MDPGLPTSDAAGTLDSSDLRNAFKRVQLLSREGCMSDLKGWESSSTDLLSLVGDMGPHDVTNVFCYYRQGHFVHQGLFSAMARRLLSGQMMDSLQNHHLSILIHSLGVFVRDKKELRFAKSTLRGPQVFQGQEDLAWQLVRESVKPHRLECFDEQGLSNIIYGMALLGLHSHIVRQGEMEITNDELTREVCKPHHLDSFNCQDLAMIIYAWGLMGYIDIEGLKKLAVRVSEPEHLKTFSEQQISNIVWGWATLRVSKGIVFPALFDEIGKAQRLERFSEQALSIIMWSFARLSSKNRIPDGVIDRIVKEFTKGERLKKCREQGLSNTLWAMGKLAFFDAYPIEALLSEATQHYRISKFKEQELANLVYGLACLCNATEARQFFSGERPSRMIALLALETNSPERLKAFTAQEVGYLCWAFKQLQNVMT